MSTELVVLDDDYCPYSCPHSDYPGIYKEVILRTFPPPEFSLTFISLPWPRAKQAAIDGNLDIIPTAGGYNWHPQWAYSSTPILTDQVCFFGQTESSWRYQGANSLKGFTLGLIDKYQYPSPIDEMRINKHISIQLVTDASTNPTERLTKMLLAQRIDLLPLLKFPTKNFLKKMQWQTRIRNLGCLPDKFSEYTAISFKTPNYKQLLRRFDQQLHALKENGELNNIYIRYGIPKDNY